MISVVIVEDQTLVREGLIRLLDFSNAIEVIASASNGREALARFSSLQPQVALVDIQLPEMDGFRFIEEFRRHQPATKFIVLTTFNDQRYIDAAMRAGAHGFLLKDVTFTQLANVIDQVAKGARVFPARPWSTLVNASTAASGMSTIETLTARERDIISRMAQGRSNKEIAADLQVSEGTVKNHVSNILSKLDVRDRTQAVIKYRESQPDGKH